MEKSLLSREFNRFCLIRTNFWLRPCSHSCTIIPGNPIKISGPRVRHIIKRADFNPSNIALVFPRHTVYLHEMLPNVEGLFVGRVTHVTHVRVVSVAVGTTLVGREELGRLELGRAQIALEGNKHIYFSYFLNTI